MICLSLAFFLFIVLCIHRLHKTKKLCFISVLEKVVLAIKNPPANARDAGDASLIPGSGSSLEEEIATHSSILAWRIPRIEQPGGLQSMGSQRVRHDLVTKQQHI